VVTLTCKEILALESSSFVCGPFAAQGDKGGEEYP
jgi:hypothetical protein